MVSPHNAVSPRSCHILPLGHADMLSHQANTSNRTPKQILWQSFPPDTHPNKQMCSWLPDKISCFPTMQTHQNTQIKTYNHDLLRIMLLCCIRLGKHTRWNTQTNTHSSFPYDCVALLDQGLAGKPIKRNTQTNALVDFPTRQTQWNTQTNTQIHRIICLTGIHFSTHQRNFTKRNM